MKMNKKGFTLIEMLVVIAIIAVLVSIVIPTVTSATEKAKEAADAANIRAAIAEVTTNALAGETDATKLTKTVTLTQTGNFDKNPELTNIGGIDKSQFAGTPGQVVTITWTAATTTAEAHVTVSVGNATTGGTTGGTTTNP